MFTGIIETVGKVTSVERSSDGINVFFSAPGCEAKNIKRGDSIAIDGICLTVTDFAGESLKVFVSNETITRSRFDNLYVGMSVNIEHPLTVDKGLGGHVVTGHVDGLAKCIEAKPDGASTHLAFLVDRDKELGQFIAEKGSIAIDGVSMTVNEVSDSESGTRFSVNMIPYTRTVTTMGRIDIGESVHIEVDILARYAHRALESVHA